MERVIFGYGASHGWLAAALSEYAWVMVAFTLSALFITSILARRTIFETLRLIRPNHAAGLIAILIMAGILRFLWLEPIEQIYYDCYEHIAISKYFGSNGIFKVCLAGNGVHCDLGLFPHWPPLYHAILAPFTMKASNPENMAYMVTAAEGVFACAMVFFACLYLFNSPSVGLGACLFWAFHPLALRFSASVDTDTLAAAFFASALAAGGVFNIRRDLPTLAFAIAACGAAGLVRPETMLAGLVAIPGFIHMIKGAKDWVARFKLLALCGAFVLAICWPALIFAFRTGQQYGRFISEQHSTYLARNLSFFLFDNGWHPAIVTIAAVIALAFWPKERRSIAWSMTAAAAIIVLYYALKHRVDTRYGDQIRFNMIPSLTLVVLAAHGLLQWANRFVRTSWFNAVVLLAFAGVCLLPAWNKIQKPIHPEGQIVQQVLDEVRKLPESAVIFSPVAAAVWAKGNFYALTPDAENVDPVLYEKIVASAKSLYFVSDVWCLHQGVPACRKINQRYDKIESVVEKPFTSGESIGLYKLKPKVF